MHFVLTLIIPDPRRLTVDKKNPEISGDFLCNFVHMLPSKTNYIISQQVIIIALTLMIIDY